MNIWILTTEYPPFFGGGIGTYVYHSAKMLTEAGEKVRVFIRSSQNSIETINENLIVHRFKEGGKDYYKFLGYTAALSYQYSEVVLEALKNEKPDIIEVQDYAALGYYLIQKKLTGRGILSDIPILITLHTPKFRCDEINQAPLYKFPDYWIGRMEQFCIKAVDGICSPSNFLMKDLSSILSENVPKSVIPNPFELKNCSEEKESASTEINNLNNDFVYFGRFEYRKGVLQLLSYCKKLWEDGVEFRLHMIGGSVYFYPFEEGLKNYIKKKYSAFIDNGLLILHDPMPQDQLYDFIAKAGYIIIPSLYENFPYTCVESMYMGKIVIASSSGGHAELISQSGVNGFIFSHNDPKSFYELIKTVLNLSDKEKKTIENNAIKRVKEYCSYSAVLPKKRSFLLDVIENHKSKKKSLFPVINFLSTNKTTQALEGGKKGLLSVIIPYYNLGKYIDETIESIVNSTYKQKEIIIVNDGSDDAYSIEKLYELENKFANHNLKIIHKKNKGLSDTRNRGAKEAEGEFICFVDADDMVYPEFFEKAIAVLNRYKNVSFVYSWVEYFDGNKGIWPTWNIEFPYLLLHNMLTAMAVIRREDFLKYGINDEDMIYGMEDYESWIRMAKNGCIGVSIPEVLVKYRVRINSMARQFNPDKILYLYSLISSKNRDIYSKYATDIFNILNTNGPSYLWDNPSLSYPQIGFKTDNIKIPEHIEFDSADDLPPDVKAKLKSLLNTKAGKLATKILLKLLSLKNR